MKGLIDRPEQYKEEAALHLVKKGRVDLLEYLLESEANCNLTDHKGRTPFEKFLEMKDMKMVQALEDTSSKARPKRATYIGVTGSLALGLSLVRLVKFNKLVIIIIYIRN